MKKQIRTRQVTRSVWQAYYTDENGNPTSDRVSESLCEKEAKSNLQKMRNEIPDAPEHINEMPLALFNALGKPNDYTFDLSFCDEEGSKAHSLKITVNGLSYHASMRDFSSQELCLAYQEIIRQDTQLKSSNVPLKNCYAI